MLYMINKDPIPGEVALLVKPLSSNWPDIANRKAFALPLVECSSSRVALKLGHMVPP
jgi:hypothetical protein